MHVSCNVDDVWFVCSGGAELEDVGGDEGGHRAWSELLHEGQDRHELQQRMHEGPDPVPLQERPPPSHRKHLQVTFFFFLDY